MRHWSFRNKPMVLYALLNNTSKWLNDKRLSSIIINPKRLGEVISPVVFPKMCFSKKQRSPGFLGLFNIIISCIFRENFIAIPEAVQKLRRFCSSISTTFTNFSDFLTFPCYKETWRQHITDEIKILLPSTYLQ